MKKAYFFINKAPSEEDAYPLVFIDETNHIAEEAPCRFDDLQERLGDYPLVVVIPDSVTTIHWLSLPLLNDKKAQAAIPFALEDYSAQELSELHFAYDRKFYQNGQYLVVSCAKSWLQALLILLTNAHVEPRSITMAWFALDTNQCILSNQSLLIRSSSVNGTIPMSMWPMTEAAIASIDGLTVLPFDKDTEVPQALANKTAIPETNWPSWAAQKLHQSPFIAINQGQFSTNTDNTSLTKSAWIIGSVLTLWLLTWLITNLLSLHHLNQEIGQVDDKISVIYRQFFPGAKQVISPRFRISQKLKSQGQGNENHLIQLLDQLATPMTSNRVTPVQLTYQNQRITLKLVANDFGQLEQFMSALKRQAIKAKQLDANRNDDKVEATVELQL